MKLETLIYDKIKKMLPQEALKTAIYANVSDTSYEIFFYCFFAQGEYRQCYELAEEDILDAHLLDAAFAEMAGVIKADKNYKIGCKNLFTFIIDSEGIKTVVEYLDNADRIYRVKKEWQEKYIHL